METTKKWDVITIIKIIILSIIFLLVVMLFASAETIYSGETKEIDLENEIVNCSANDSEGLKLSWNNTILTISTHPLFKTSKLSITCLVIKEREIVIKSTSSGGSNCRYNKNFDWKCTEWSECDNGTRVRNCLDYNNCRNTYGKPNEIQSCPIETEVKVIKIEEEKGKSILDYIVIGYIILMLLILISYKILKRIKKN